MSLKPRTVAIGCLAIALLVGFWIGGGFMYRAAIGLDPSAFPFGEAMHALGATVLPKLGLSLAGMALAFLSIVAVGIASFAAVRASVRSSRSETGPDRARRNLLTGALASAGTALGAMAVSGAALYARAFRGVGNAGRGWAPVAANVFGGEVVKTHPEWKESWKGSRIRRYGRLGRTGWKVSDIVLGTGPLDRERGVEIVRLALQRGINYVDTSPDYSTAGSESAVGLGIAGIERGEFFLATKWCTPRGHLPPGTPVAVYRENLEASLARLGTDYVDLVHVHSCDEIDRLLDPNMFEAFRQLRAEGKVRFLGFSTHTPNLIQVASAAIDSGRFDVMMLAYHHGIWPRIGEVIERAQREQDMGVVAMKTLKGAKHHGLVGFREEADAYSQAALRWALSNSSVSCAVISFFQLQHIDEYLHASGGDPSAADRALLQKYDEQIRDSYCSPHCGVCLDSCPEELAIHDVLRHRMYFEDYGWQREGMRLYSQLEKNAEICTRCSAPCTGSCPVGIPIRERMQGAHELLTLG